jgi:rRNA maturation protein Rpf1
LFLRKEANCSKELWKQHCIKHMSADIKYITYADIFKILNEVVFSSKKEKEQVLTFYTKRLESFITRNLVGFEDIVDKVYINIKLKGNDK